MTHVGFPLKCLVFGGPRPRMGPRSSLGRLQGSTLPQSEPPELISGASILQVDILAWAFHPRNFRGDPVENEHLGAFAPAPCTEFRYAPCWHSRLSWWTTFSKILRTGTQSKTPTREEVRILKMKSADRPLFNKHYDPDRGFPQGGDPADRRSQYL